MVFLDYLKAGFIHVLPMGYDHVLFITALFFLNSELRTAIVQCSVFTLAHSLTLILAASGKIGLQFDAVESLIALSIFFVAAENLFRLELSRWRLVSVFLFGLLHGLGFAGVLKTFGIPGQDFLPALLGFNVGVELAQVAVIAVCFLFIAKPFRHRDWYREKFVQPVSLGIACLALFWSVERFLAG